VTGYRQHRRSDYRQHWRSLVQAARRLAEESDRLGFGPPVAWVYNPLRYARAGHEAYLERYGSPLKRVVFLGMNPGPWGMAQTGVPFGEVGAVRNWLGIEEQTGRPEREHPRRPVLGMACPRSEVSGQRIWGLMRERFGTADSFFRAHFIANYCPLLFLDAEGRNLTPDRLRPADRDPLLAVCDRHLEAVLEILEPRWAIGIGRFAEGCLRRVAGGGLKIAGIPHPSPANPAANRDWASRTAEVLVGLGVWK
jgi:single-strand selective monofunctional uracil DNA glycosylase